MPHLAKIVRLAALGPLIAAARGAESAPLPVTSEIVELPRFEVSGTRVLPPPEKWHYAPIPGFEVLSSVSERETKRFVADFLLLQEAIGVLMPGMKKGDVNIPTSLILCGRGDDFNRFMPADRGDDVYRTNALFFDDPEHGVIVVDFALRELLLETGGGGGIANLALGEPSGDPDDSSVAEPSSGGRRSFEADPYRSFYKEYFRHLVRRQMGRRPPVWFEEGLVQMFSAIDFNNKWITWAQLGDGFGGGKDSDFTRMLSQRALMPLPEMFAREKVETDHLWSAQCYAFVHMCLYGRNQRYQHGFRKFLSRLGSEQPSERLFTECFSKTYKEMGVELRGYLDFTDHKYIQLKAKKGQALPEPPAFELREATEAESGRIVGEALRHGGHGEGAHLALIAPYVRGSRDPQLLASLGLDERRAGNDERAKKFLEAAMKAKAARPRAYLELARLRYTAINAANGAKEDKSLTADQVADVLQPLLIARSQQPPMAEVYELIAEVWSRNLVPPTLADLKSINEGLGPFGRRPQFLVRAADLNLRHGSKEVARNIIEFGLKALPDSPARHALERLKAELPPDPNPPLAAPASDLKPAPKK